MKIFWQVHMKFLKDNSYDIVKLLINQMGIAIFSLVLYTSVSTVFDKDPSLSLTVKIFISIFATLFFFALIYTAAWDMGAKDKIRVDGGKAKPSPLKGALVGLAANSLNILLAVLAVVFWANYLNTSLEGFKAAFAVVNLIMRFICSMFIGMLQGISDGMGDGAAYLFDSYGFLVLLILTVMVTAIGYLLGLKDKKIFSFIYSKNQKTKE